MSIVKVREYFKQFGIEDRILEFDVSSKTVYEASLALNCKEAEIAKSLAFKLDDKPIMIVTKGDAKIDNQKYKQQFHQKAKMLTYDEVSEMIGHEVGGVCPFAINDGVVVYLDVSLKQFDKVYPACGSGNSAIGFTIEELMKYSNFTDWVDVCKD